MIKIVIVILLIFNILACEPVQQASNKAKIQQPKSFVCLSTQNTCEINAKVGRFTIQFSGDIEQGRIKTEMPFQIQLILDAPNENFQLKNISSYLEGKEMFMGKIPVFFQSSNSKANVVVAEALLASCSEEMMTWRLWFQVDVEIDKEIQYQKFFIDFDSQRL
jgi:hypothetical protein